MAPKIDVRRLQLIAEEAARIIAEEGISDYHLAKNKAVKRLGLPDKTRLPNNHEIEQAVILRQALFQGDTQATTVRELREIALGLMQVLTEFDPHLVGPVLKGTATQHSTIQLHLFSEDPKNIAIALLNLGIEYQAIVRRQHSKNPEGYKGFAFIWQEAEVDCLVFPAHKLRISPPSPVDGKPMRRADQLELEQMLST